jgi:hypothetical protein
MTTLTQIAQKKKQDARAAFIVAAWADEAPYRLAELASDAGMELADADACIARVADARRDIKTASEVLRLRRVASKAKAHADAIRTRTDAAVERLESEADGAAHDATSAMREASSAESAALRVIAMHDEGMLPASQLPKDVLALIERREQEAQAARTHATMVAVINVRNRVRDDVERLERKLWKLPLSVDRRERETLLKEELERAKAGLTAAEARLADAERAHATARKGL